MRKEKNLFKLLCVGTTISFLVCGYSLVMCFAFEGSDGELGSHILEIMYLFMHLIICAIIFYLGFRAVRFGSFFIKNNVYDYEGVVYKKRWIVYIVLDSLFLALFTYSFIQAISMKLPLAKELGKVVWHDLMNASFLLFFIFLVFVLYPLVPYNHDNKHAEEK